MRAIRQPGPALEPRAVVVPAMLHPCDIMLPAGALLLDTLRDALAARGFRSGAFTIASGGFSPFGYVIPALSPDATRAAWYSEARRPPGVTRLEQGALTFGLRDGASFFHCHATWHEADGARRGGHILPEETVIAAPIRLTGVALSGAVFEVSDDPETGFRLFAPVATDDTRPDGHPGLALRLRPNQDITLAIKAIAQGAGYPRAVLRGGVGSIIGARFAGAPDSDVPFTEMFIRAGGSSRPLDIAMVDVEDRLSEGTLVRGENPVLMTLEAVLDPEGD
ncbi:MAG: hypothetical protein JWO24_287 [Rhodospirillales bacterium]|jgi:predicted DNA-binding protein with PD1-like motif|nr:hypothetical protein [Rhodospirillales bacterium]